MTKNNNDNNNSLTMIRHVFKTSFPMMMSHFIMTISGFISTLILSYVSLDVFSASMLISSVQLVISIVPFALLFCIGPVISQIFGSKQNNEQIGLIFRSALWVSFYISFTMMSLLWFMGPILLFLGQPTKLVAIADSYFYAFLWSIPGIALMRVAMQLLYGLFKQQIALLFSIASLVLSSLLGYLLVFGAFGFPRLGVAGLGWGFTIHVYVVDAILLIYLLSNSAFKSYRLFAIDTYADMLATQKKLFAIGFPITLQMGNELLSFFITTIMVGWLGAMALTANQIAVRYLLLLVIPLFGLSQAAGLFVGKHFGEKNFHAINRYTRLILSIGLIYSIAIVIVFWMIPEPFITLFVSKQDVTPSFVQLVSLLLVLVAISQVFDATRTILTGALRGFNDTRYSMWVSVALTWPVGLTLAYLFGFTLGWGLIGIAVAHLVAGIVAAVLIYIRWKYLLDKKKYTRETHDNVLLRASNNAT